jgi:hypothetical protein
MSPAPQYGAPYQPPGSQAPVSGYGQDVKHTYEQVAHPEAAELGGASSGTGVPAVATQFTAELEGGNARK